MQIVVYIDSMGIVACMQSGLCVRKIIERRVEAEGSS